MEIVAQPQVGFLRLRAIARPSRERVTSTNGPRPATTPPRWPGDPSGRDTGWCVRGASAQMPQHRPPPLATLVALTVECRHKQRGCRVPPGNSHYGTVPVGAEGLQDASPTSRAPAKSRFVPICPMVSRRGRRCDRVGPGQEPAANDRQVRTFGADRDFAGALDRAYASPSDRAGVLIAAP